MRPFEALSSTAEDPSLDEAPILHVDLDAFFASVEILDDPSLRGRPVAVGGAGARGVVASASYEARRYGVRSGMASVVALRLCRDLVMLPGRFDRYEAYSRRFHELVCELTPEVEPLGLDEVFADLRSLRRLEKRPLAEAHALRTRIHDELHLDCGVGLARNKLFAKLASKDSKPSVHHGALRPGAGVVWVSPALEQRWLAELPVRALWGVGPATADKLAKLGLRWVRDLARVDESTLAAHVGPSLAATLVAYASGEDRREVVVERSAKSLGHDQTFARSLAGFDEVREALGHHAGVVARALRERGRVARTISITVRFDDMTSITRSQTLSFGVDDEVAIGSIAEALAASLELQHSVRLLGLYASSFLERSDNEVQLSFSVGESPDARARAAQVSRQRQVGAEALRDALDEVRRKFGASAVGTADQLGEDGLDVTTQRGRHAFGPEDRPGS
ncbi:MAG TPA: DNA polymerase IV [Acidimicrobiales bacterium]|nr:DNA polymerase IV [Acidimicrobiales bacterium]